MAATWKVISLLILLIAIAVFYLTDDTDKYQTGELLERYGYKYETHIITTADGYLLTFYRVPGVKNAVPSKGSVLLMHGIVGSSASFTQLGPERSIALVLADDGYDVWIGNFRGNHYSRDHLTHDPFWDNDKFYNFTIHELGYHDIPAAVDYILNKTGEKDLHYVGLSLATTCYFICAASRPEYQGKIRLATLMAPIAAIEHYPAWSLFNVLSSYVDYLEKLCQVLRIHELPLTTAIRISGAKFCDNPAFSFFCQEVFVVTAGGRRNARHLKDYMGVISANSPTHTSSKVLIHLGQLIKNGGFSQFDYGPKKNLEVYGGPKPPIYDLQTIKTPVALYYGQEDTIARIADIKNLKAKLPKVVTDYLIPSPDFSHASFLYSPDVAEVLYKKLLTVMSQY